MTSIQSVAFTSRPQKQENQYSGLKTGIVYTGIAGAGAYGLKKSVDPMTKCGVKLQRKLIAEQNKNIAEAFRNIKYAESFKSGAGEPIKEASIEIAKRATKIKNHAYKTASEIFKARKGLKNVSLLKSFGLAAPFMIGMGLMVDLLNNEQRKNNEPNAKTDKGNEYTKVNMGKKTGFVGGVAVEAALMFLQKDALKKIGTKPAEKALGLVIGGIGGYILGAIADKIANKQAAKAADKA